MGHRVPVVWISFGDGSSWLGNCCAGFFGRAQNELLSTAEGVWKRKGRRGGRGEVWGGGLGRSTHTAWERCNGNNGQISAKSFGLKGPQVWWGAWPQKANIWHPVGTAVISSFSTKLQRVKWGNIDFSAFTLLLFNCDVNNPIVCFTSRCKASRSNESMGKQEKHEGKFRPFFF